VRVTVVVGEISGATRVYGTGGVVRRPASLARFREPALRLRFAGRHGQSSCGCGVSENTRARGEQWRGRVEMATLVVISESDFFENGYFSASALFVEF